MRLPSPLHILALCPLLLAAPAAGAAGQATVYTSEEPYDIVLENVRFAVIGQGLVVAGTLHIQDMLARTAEDLGYPDGVFSHADTIEFCSAVMSHELVQAHPANVTLCPFTISVYELADQPGVVHVAYREPVLAGDDAAEAQAKVKAFLDGIAREAVE